MDFRNDGGAEGTFNCGTGSGWSIVGLGIFGSATGGRATIGVVIKDGVSSSFGNELQSNVVGAILGSVGVGRTGNATMDFT